MLKKESKVIVADNTGAKTALIIGIPGGTRKRTARIGDIVTVVIKTANSGGMVKKGQVMKALVVRTAKETNRKDGTSIRFGDNAVVLFDINDKGELKPKGKRIPGPIAREIKEYGYNDTAGMAMEVI